MKKHLTLLLVLFLMIPCGGCMPYHFTKKPGISGTVLDSKTKEAIPEAIVELTTWSFPEKKEKIETISTAVDGSFVLLAEQYWSIYIVPLDPGPLKVRVSIGKNGYIQFTKEFNINTMGPSVTSFEKILLEHLP